MLGIYARLSREDKESKSIENQIKSGKEFATSLNLDYKIYKDDGVSGTSSIADRPNFEKLMQDVLNGIITNVFVTNQDRLERSPEVWFTISKIFKKQNVKLFFEGGKQFDFDDAESMFMGSLSSLMNRYYVEIITKKSKAVIERNVKEGKIHGMIPYGFAKDEKGFLVIDEEEKEVVKEIYRLSLSGMGTSSIANRLNELNIPTRYKKIGKGTYKVNYKDEVKILKKEDSLWRANTVRSIIKNPIYKGIRIWKNHNIEVDNIIEPDYWEEVNSNLPKNANNTGKKVYHQYLLKGVLTCGECGRNMYGRSRENKKDHYYQCSSKRYKEENCKNRSINIDKIEGIIWSRFFKGNDLLSLLKKDIVKDDDKIEILNDKLVKLKKTLSSTIKDKEELINLSIRGLFSDDEIKDKKNQIDSKIKDIGILIKDIENQISNSKNSKKLIDEYISEFEKYTDKLTFLEKKEIINKYIKEIIVLSWDKQPNLYSLILMFRINLENEHYIFYKPTNTLVSLNDRSIINSKYFNPKSQNIISVENNLLAKIWVLPETKEIIAPPYEIVKEKMIFHLNNLIPYYTLPINKKQWSKESIINFYEENPKFLCEESGISIISKDENQKYYEELKRDYQNFKNNPLSEWVDFIMNQPKSS